MVQRYFLTAPAASVAREFDVNIDVAFPSRYNIAPMSPIAIIRQNERRARMFALAAWGFIPGWARGREIRSMANARAETAAEMTSFASAFKRRRCLVPANGFFKWQGASGAKQSYCVRPEGGALFAMAGLWETAVDADGGEVDTSPSSPARRGLILPKSPSASRWLLNALNMRPGLKWMSVTPTSLRR